jgi:competence protein ComEC
MFVAIAVWWGLPSGQPEGECTIHVLAVGDGSAALIRTVGGSALIDAGTAHNFDVGHTVIHAAAAVGARPLQLAVISHEDLDHYSGMPRIAERLTPRELVTHNQFKSIATTTKPGRRLLASLDDHVRAWKTVSRGDRMQVGEAGLEVLWPPGDASTAWEENDRSLVLQLRAYGLRVLLPGDAAEEALGGLLELHRARQIDLRSDVLIAPHHGSVIPRLTEAFYRAVEPECVIASTGKPRPELKAMLQTFFGGDCRYFSTGDSGAVSIRMTQDSRLFFETPFAQDSGFAD